MNLKKPFKMGRLCLSNNIIYAPMAGYTDFPFRKLVRHFHKGLIFCEMMMMEALVREKGLRILKFTKDMKPIGAQICGNNPATAKNAAKIIEDLGFDIIDLNCGCPAPKIIKNENGSFLLRNPLLIYKILNAIKSSVSIPLSLKIRLGWDENSICAKEIIQIAKDAGCCAVTIHARTKKHSYADVANWNYIKECKESAKDILIIGNGDLFTPFDIENIFYQTKCDGVMIARGMLQNPNISAQIEEYFQSRSYSILDKKNVILKYIEYCIDEKGVERTLLDIRKICGWLLKDVKNIKYLRSGVNSARSTKKAIEIINNFNWKENAKCSVNSNI